jgi:hypothetical protein
VSQRRPSPPAAEKVTRKRATKTPVRLDALSTLLHDLQNTLASLKLRVSILAADPTCRWAQEENVDAIRRIVDEALNQADGIRAAARPSANGRKHGSS